MAIDYFKISKDMLEKCHEYVAHKYPSFHPSYPKGILDTKTWLDSDAIIVLTTTLENLHIAIIQNRPLWQGAVFGWIYYKRPTQEEAQILIDFVNKHVTKGLCAGCLTYGPFYRCEGKTEKYCLRKVREALNNRVFYCDRVLGSNSY